MRTVKVAGNQDVPAVQLEMFDNPGAELNDVLIDPRLSPLRPDLPVIER
jgi:hypothetical protein